MKKLRFGQAVAALAILFACAAARADSDPIFSSVWEVATVNGYHQFEISPDGTQLDYDVQPKNGYIWNENNGSAPGTIATYKGENRTGSKTYASTDVAAGAKVSDLKLTFSYNSTLTPGTRNDYSGIVSINFFLTDGAGHYGIFAPNSGGIAAIATSYTYNGDWTTISIDLTSANAALLDSSLVAIYEHSGFSATKTDPYTSLNWGDIKDYTIAGMFDYQRSPQGGWDDWSGIWSTLNQNGSTALLNEYGVALIWGDTVGNPDYTTQERSIKDVYLTVGTTTYSATFNDASVPEPATVLLLGLGALGAVARRRKQS